jgi:hypothetical protein
MYETYARSHDLKGILSETGSVLFKNGNKAVWLSTAKSDNVTLTFATAANSTAVRKDFHLTSTELWPSVIPGEIRNAKVAGFIVEITSGTNSTVKTLNLGNLIVSWSAKEPISNTYRYRGKPLKIKTNGANADILSQIVKAFSLIIPGNESIDVSRDNGDFWAAIYDIGSFLDAACASSLTIVLAVKVVAIMCTPDIDSKDAMSLVKGW